MRKIGDYDMKINTLPDRQELMKYFSFDFDNGKIYKKVCDGHKEIGSSTTHGYSRIHYKGKLYLSHRILYYCYHNKDIGQSVIDHINGDKTDNRIQNLRHCSHKQNSRNRTNIGSNNSTGHTNISKFMKKYSNGKEYEYWQLQLYLDKKSEKQFNKLFSTNKHTLEDVIKYRDKKRKELYGQFAGSV